MLDLYHCASIIVHLIAPNSCRDERMLLKQRFHLCTILTCKVLQVVSVEFTLQRGYSDRQHIFVFRGQEFGECGVVFSLLGMKNIVLRKQ